MTRALCEHRRAMPWYTFRGPIQVFDDENDVEVDDGERLQKLDGLTYDDETMAEQLDFGGGRLEEADIEGGTIELRWIGDHLEVCTAYEIAGTLEPDEIDDLRQLTYSQWESGIGLTLVAQFLDRTGLRLDLAPEEASELEVDIET